MQGRIFEEREQNAASLDAAAIRKLASQITGHVITPEAPDYEPSRLVGNRAYDRHPALIVRCAGASDVTRALDFGQSLSLPLAVRGGGHSAAGFGACDGGLVIDLSGMKRVEVDADKRVAHAEAGSLVRDVDEATQRFGLATTLGYLPDRRNCRADARRGPWVLSVEVRHRVRQRAIGAHGDGGRQATGG
jgi:hypothetical protein